MKAVLLVALCVLGCRKPQEPLRVAAASDLTDAFTEMGALYEQRTGRKVTFSFASSGLLAKQIAEGAPFSLFAAANTSFVDQVISAGACDGATRAQYARGRIGVWTPARVGGVHALSDLAAPRFEKIAIADPEHAPYGRAAKEALDAAGMWTPVQRRIIYGENIQQTMSFVDTGYAQAAIVALSLVVGKPNGDFMLIDEHLHKPLDQALVLCGKRDVEAARKLAALIGSSDGRRILKKYGFVLPGAP
jgi:molybdate transport system substrate-binding protein